MIVSYQLFYERDERLQVLFEREVKLIAVLEVDGDCTVLLECVLCRIAQGPYCAESRPSSRW